MLQICYEAMAGCTSIVTEVDAGLVGGEAGAKIPDHIRCDTVHRVSIPNSPSLSTLFMLMALQFCTSVQLVQIHIHSE